MKAVVVGAGAWGTAFSSLLAARGHDVTLACRDPEQARAIEETGHNPRYLSTADLSGVSATTIDDPSLAGADLHVIAVPSQAFGQVARALPGAAPVLSLTKGLDPETGERLSELVERRGADRQQGPWARARASGGGQLAHLPGLRERGPRGRRALRSREERDGARRRRRGRARARGQREGGADCARSRRDGTPGR